MLDRERFWTALWGILKKRLVGDTFGTWAEVGQYRQCAILLLFSIWIKLGCGIVWASHPFYPFRADTSGPLSNNPGQRTKWLSVSSYGWCVSEALSIIGTTDWPSYMRGKSLTFQDKCEILSEWKSLRPRSLKPLLVSEGTVFRELFPH